MKQFFLLLALILLLGSCTKQIYKTKTESHFYKISDEESMTDTSVSALIRPYKMALDIEMEVEVGYCPKPLTLEQPESALGNWMADLIQEQAAKYFKEKIDLAAQNYGSIRIPSLPKGYITKGKIFELMPFENRMVLLYIKGDILQQFFDRMARAGGWPISESVKYKIENDKAIDIYIGVEKLDLEKTYKLALPDYIANGGDDCDFFKGVKRKESPKLVREAIFEYINNYPKIRAEVEGRVVKK